MRDILKNIFLNLHINLFSEEEKKAGNKQHMDRNGDKSGNSFWISLADLQKKFFLSYMCDLRNQIYCIIFISSSFFTLI